MSPGLDSFALAVCIGCGCHDLRACCNEDSGQPCAWVRLDRTAAAGVCSECSHLVARWDTGERRRQGHG